MKNRYAPGDVVWVRPDSGNSTYLADDAGTVLDDLVTGYLVIQEHERVDSYGEGHFVTDAELESLVS